MKNSKIKTLKPSDSEDPWVTLDEYQDDFIVGNRAGLESLKKSIDFAIKNGDAEVMEEADDFVIRRILFRGKDEYLNSIQAEVHEDTLREKLIGGAVITWFIVMPFVALALLAYLFFGK